MKCVFGLSVCLCVLVVWEIFCVSFHTLVWSLYFNFLWRNICDSVYILHCKNPGFPIWFFFMHLFTELSNLWGRSFVWTAWLAFLFHFQIVLFIVRYIRYLSSLLLFTSLVVWKYFSTLLSSIFPQIIVTHLHYKYQPTRTVSTSIFHCSFLRCFFNASFFPNLLTLFPFAAPSHYSLFHFGCPILKSFTVLVKFWSWIFVASTPLVTRSSLISVSPITLSSGFPSLSLWLLHSLFGLLMYISFLYIGNFPCSCHPFFPWHFPNQSSSVTTNTHTHPSSLPNFLFPSSWHTLSVPSHIPTNQTSLPTTDTTPHQLVIRSSAQLLHDDPFPLGGSITRQQSSNFVHSGSKGSEVHYVTHTQRYTYTHTKIHALKHTERYIHSHTQKDIYSHTYTKMHRGTQTNTHTHPMFFFSLLPLYRFLIIVHLCTCSSFLLTRPWCCSCWVVYLCWGHCIDNSSSFHVMVYFLFPQFLF